MALQYPGMSTIVENAMEMAGPNYDPASVIRALNQMGLQKKRYKDEFAQRQTEFEKRFGLEQKRFGLEKMKLTQREKEFAKKFGLSEEQFAEQKAMNASNLELNQARSGREEQTLEERIKSAEYGRGQEFYGSATPSQREQFRDEYSPTFGGGEAMVNVPGVGRVPASQAALYSQGNSLLNYGQPSSSRIANAPPGTPSNRQYGAVSSALGRLREYRREDTASSRTPPNPYLPYGMENPINIARSYSYR